MQPHQKQKTAIRLLHSQGKQSRHRSGASGNECSVKIFSSDKQAGWFLTIFKIPGLCRGMKNKTTHERMNGKAPQVGGIFNRCDSVVEEKVPHPTSGLTPGSNPGIRLPLAIEAASNLPPGLAGLLRISCPRMD
jgi:hypothetical protein